MLALALVLSALPVIWIGQTVLRRRAGLPMRWRLSAHGAPHGVRVAARTLTQLTLAAIIIVYPLLLHANPIRYYAALLPAGRPSRAAAVGFFAALLYLAVLYLIWAVTDRVRFSIRHKPGRITRHFVALPFSAALGATVEEAIFRGVLLAGLLDSFPMPIAVAVGTLLFAAAHYVREVKRAWTFPGHLMLGLCLCLTFVWTGALWLPIGVHAGGIFAIMAVRPFARYQGPAWLTGASIFPYAGVVGVAALALLTTALGFHYKGLATP